MLVAEGADVISAALAAGAPVESVYWAPGAVSVPALAEVIEVILDAGGRAYPLAPGVMERVADTVTPQPVLAVVGYRPAALDAVAGASLVLVLDEVRDPGNAGTLIRAADAAGADAVVCTSGTVDPTNPKAVRASAGSIFHLPVVESVPSEDLVHRLEGRGLDTVVTVARGGGDYAAFDWSRPVAVAVGNEAHGVTGVVAARAAHRVSIPMPGTAESLNVAMAAGIVLFEAVRQRRQAGGIGSAPAAAGPRGPALTPDPDLPSAPPATP